MAKRTEKSIDDQIDKIAIASRAIGAKYCVWCDLQEVGGDELAVTYAMKDGHVIFMDGTRLGAVKEA